MKTSIWNRTACTRSKRGALKVEVVHPKKSVFERISDWVPIAISLLALWAAIDSQRQTMSHNRLSVRPQMGFLAEDNYEATNVGLFIENSGLGPARIERLNVYFDGHPIAARDMDVIYKSTRAIFRKTSPQWYTSEYAFNVKSGERQGIFFTPPSNVANVPAFQNLIDERLFVIGEACSPYEECTYFCSSVENERCLEEEKKIRK